jgi:hypothetical protein
MIREFQHTAAFRSRQMAQSCQFIRDRDRDTTRIVKITPLISQFTARFVALSLFVTRALLPCRLACQQR